MKKTMQLLASLFGVAITTVSAQSIPGADIFIADLSVQNGQLKLGELKNISSRKGYDNQPYFLADNQTLLYTSQIDGQTDILRYKINTGETENLSSSPESEYSPTPMPNGTEYSVIYAVDGKQELWAYQLAGEGKRALYSGDELIGYHAWIDSQQVLVTVLQESSMNLQLFDSQTRTLSLVYPLTGASLYQIPESHLMSFNTLIDGKHWLMQLDTKTQATQKLVELPEESQYYTWTADGKVIVASNLQLWFWDSQVQNATLSKFADFEKTCPEGASRIAVNKQQTKLALVCHGDKF
ncbi:TolB family protein [Aliiglaciecola lipolytica]|uniref:Uncharacterized protein n=1 Tax=Aliiglaciecola lipolytica E3 TaxID=1127673 RepID=K6WX22_9ALTE|nr:PD40 domain-containing protein [Aliiglaciecola lipolytica]GAC12999.1 hypothetical protein GLIP_0352 [Aliiglaciecola lipolytica E3]